MLSLLPSTKWLSGAVVLCLLLLLSACGQQQSANESGTQHFVGTDVSGADFANSFQLTDHTGKPRQLTDFKGKVLAIFFGYTHCPDVCPTTMADLAQAMKLLGKASDEVQVLFITVDPERDTQEVLAKFVPSFDSRFIGLYGNAAQTEATTKNFKIFASKQTEAGKSGYVIDHSAGVYLYDKTAKVRVYLNFGQKPAEIARDIKQLL